MSVFASKLRIRRFALAAFAASLTISTAQAAVSRSASIVVDANSGKIMQEAQADEPRYPASITKVMTLYILFEQLEAKRFTLESKLKISSYASAKPPSKLGLKAGSEIRVEDAIMALVTRSANDIATAIGENIAGSEYAFAQMMTRKARSLGMTNTTFKNASGLPDMEQKTTARDLATLGRAMYERFPTYTPYFSRTVFNYKGQRIGNHNRLLGRVRGVDGIKTGYTNASGFNLLTSAHLNGRHVVAVVMGGATGRQRDAKMATLVASYLPRASATKVVDKQLIARIYDKKGKNFAVAARDEKKKANEETFAQSAEALENAAGGKALAMAPIPLERKRLVDIVAPAIAAAQDDAIDGEEENDTPSQLAAVSEDNGMRWNVGAKPVAASQDESVTASVMPSVPASVMPNGQPSRARPQVSKMEAMQDIPQDAQPAMTNGWIVQIAAAPTEDGAMKVLSEAKAKAQRLLAEAKPFTERVVKGNSTLYRARFGGFAERETADAACAALKKKSYSCLTIRL